MYRDQQFSADMNSRAVKRISDVARLRAAQFSEDRGPMAHPVRPDSYVKMDNFYTSTVYEKASDAGNGMGRAREGAACTRRAREGAACTRARAIRFPSLR